MDAAWEEALTVVNPGEFFGDMSVFDDLPRSATVIGNAPGTLLLSIGRSSIGELCELNQRRGPFLSSRATRR